MFKEEQMKQKIGTRKLRKNEQNRFGTLEGRKLKTLDG